MHHSVKRIGVALAAAAGGVLVLAAGALVVASFFPSSAPRWGVTFSPDYARQLGLDAGAAYHAMLDDLGVRAIRFPLYWDDVERTQGVYDWTDADWYLWDAGHRGLDVTLVVGARVPRWPECHIPAWARGLPPEEMEAALLQYVAAAAERFKDHPAVARWQVENEPGFTWFGDCPPMPRRVLDAELAAVRAVAAQPVQLTASGELQAWAGLARRADVLGVSMYRRSWNPFFGFITYPVPPSFYRVRAWLVRPFVEHVVVSELQAEPWFAGGEDPRDPAFAERFTPRDLAANAAYARRTGLPEAYLWGVEWWYLLKEQGRPELWEAAKELFLEERAP